jgi:serine/threonine-protein kinase
MSAWAGSIAAYNPDVQRGDRVGPYEITGHIGTGGMGSVYRARDTRLQRDVAIKVLPDLFARDPERLARFTREGQALALLNHPNVAHVYGIVDLPAEGARRGDGSHGDPVQGVVMECVDGEDLAERLTRGAIPVDECIAIAVQIAGGLETAHERGLVHRDLKPGNIRLTPDATVKILDFGLAKAMNEDAGATADPRNSPTFTSPGTQLGVILGTAAYMAPEQARGKPVDRRADIWAFGCVLYEMLTAKRPFGGDSVTDAIAAIIKEDPDWSALPADTPAGLRELLRRCLVKDPKQRLRDIGDARIALESIASSPAAAGPVSVVRPAPRRASVLLMAAGMTIVAALASLTTWLLTRSAAAPAAPLAHFVTPLPIDALPLRIGGTGVAFAPDGSSVVYAAQPALTAAPSLFRRRMDAVVVERIPNTEGAIAPFFSPDGRWIGYLTDTAVMKVSVDGQTRARICDRTRFSRAVWGPGDTILLGTGQIYSNGPLATVSANGGTSTDFTTLAGKEAAHQLPHVLPDGRNIVFTVISPGRTELATVSSAGGAHRYLGVEGSGPIFVAPAHLLFARGRTMFAVPFDPVRVQVLGNPVQVLDDAGVFSGAANVWIPMLGADRAGSIAYLNKAGTLSTLRWISPASVAIPVPDADYRTPKLSPDGRRLVAAAASAPSEIWVIDLDRGTRLLLSSSGGTAPIWSHDGQRIIYAGPTGDVMTVPADGSGTPEILLPRQDPFSAVASAVAPDGSFLIVSAENRAATAGNRNRDVWLIRSGEKPIVLVGSPADERGAVVSPDGRWIAYSSNVSGREEIYVKSIGGSGRTIPVSTEGGSGPRWPRMDSLYFLGPRSLMRAAITPNPFSVGAATEALVVPQNIGGLDIHSDGRILIVEPRGASGVTRDALHVLLNWGRSLKSPADR